jgi:hypothetical protein
MYVWLEGDDLFAVVMSVGGGCWEVGGGEMGRAADRSR